MSKPLVFRECFSPEDLNQILGFTLANVEQTKASDGTEGFLLTFRNENNVACEIMFDEASISPMYAVKEDLTPYTGENGGESE